MREDFDPKHSSRLGQEYLKRNEKEDKVKATAWPLQSPDLNPIQLVWDEMDRKVKAKQPNSPLHLPARRTAIYLLYITARRGYYFDESKTRPRKINVLNQ